MKHIAWIHPNSLIQSAGMNLYANRMVNEIPIAACDNYDPLRSRFILTVLLPDDYDGDTLTFTIFWTYATVQTVIFRITNAGVRHTSSQRSTLSPFEIAKSIIVFDDPTSPLDGGQVRKFYISSQQTHCYILGVLIESDDS